MVNPVVSMSLSPLHQFRNINRACCICGAVLILTSYEDNVMIFSWHVVQLLALDDVLAHLIRFEASMTLGPSSKITIISYYHQWASGSLQTLRQRDIFPATHVSKLGELQHNQWIEFAPQ
jgi:hypothetical protein